MSVVDATWNLLGQFASVFAAVAAAIPFGVALRGWYTRHLGSRWELKRRLVKMAVGVTGDHVRSLFGVPVMQYEAPGIKDAIDYLFRTNHAWVVARVRNGAVSSWSVTVTDRKLKIDLRDLSFGLVQGRLGHSTASQVVEQPNGVFEERGAATYAYAERKYFGRPSAYQSFVFMYNTEGIGTYNPSGQDIVASYPFLVAGSPVGDTASLAGTRSATTVNTFLSCGRDDSFLTGGWARWPVVIHELVMPLRAAERQRKNWLKKRGN